MEQRIINSLLKGSAYPEAPEAVELVQTHISLIFLTTLHAYKVKKPVDFGFLNFSSLDRRRFYCNEEVRLNRRLCPDMYLGVVELRETPNGAAFHGEGRVIDYAVKMRRLPEQRMLHRLLERNLASEQDIRRIAAKVADFHLDAQGGPDIDPSGSPEAIRQNWADNLAMVESFGGATISDRNLAIIRDRVDSFMEENDAIFRERVAEGRIRDCDGDLHTENICIEENGSIQIFDCIEFNNRFRFSDTAADIAFLLMDLEFHERVDLSDLFLEEYLAATQDHGATRLLDFYKMYRSFIRGKVATLKMLDPLPGEEEKKVAWRRASRHFHLARGYALRAGLPPSLFITCGPSGSGKSTLSRELSFQLGLGIVSSDRTRKELSGIAPTDRHAGGYDDGIYTREFSRLTYAEMLERCRKTLMGGRSVVADATFARREDRELFRKMAEQMGAPFHIIDLECRAETVRERLSVRSRITDEVSDATWEIYQRQAADWESLDPGDPSIISVDAALDPTEMTEAILKGLELL